MLFLLDKTSQTSRWNGLPLHEASSAVVSEALNGDFKLTMSYPLSDTQVYQLLETDKIIKSPVPLLGPQLFRIREVVEGDDAVEVVAYHITDDIMRRSISPLALHQVGCQTALSQVVTRSKSSLVPFSLSSDIATLHTFHTEKAETLYSVLLDGKHSLVGTWEGELVRDNFSLAIKARRGADRGVIISTHKNLKQYERKQVSQSVITRLHLRSTIKEGEDERVLSLTLDSPLINHYPYIQEAEFENNNLMTLDELRKWGEAKFKYEGIDKPRDTITIEVYELEGQEVHLGDWVRIKSRKHQVDLLKQAISYEYNALTQSYVSLIFDDKAPVGGSSMASPLSSFAKEVLGAADTVQELAIKEAVENANRAFEATFEKEKENLEAEIEVVKSRAEKVKSELSQVVTHMEGRAQDLSRQVVASDTKVSQLLQQVGVSTSIATVAKETADAAKESLSFLNQNLDETKRDLLVKGNQLTGLTRDLIQLQTDTGGLRTALSQRLTSNQVESLIAGKGYLTSSALNHYISTTVFDSYKRETNQLYEQVFGSMEGDLITNLFHQIMTSSVFQTEVQNPLSGMSTKVQQLSDSWAIKQLTSSGTVLSQLNVNTGGVKIQGRLIHLNGQTLIDNGVIKNAMIDSVHGGKITAGSITSAILSAEAVTADKLKVDQAFFNKLMVNETYLKQLFAKNAFITQVQAVTLSANKISGGVLTALNNAMSINLNQANITFNSNATVTFNSSNNALIRRKGTHTAFVHFNDVNSSSDGGVGSLYAAIGVTSSGDGLNSASSGRFCGARFFRGAWGTAHDATVDQAEIYGDNIIFKDGFDVNRGFRFQPTTIDKVIDMNYLVGAVRSLARCWLHMNNVAWNPQDGNLGRAVIAEYNAHMKDL